MRMQSAQFWRASALSVLPPERIVKKVVFVPGALESVMPGFPEPSMSPLMVTLPPTKGGIPPGPSHRIEDDSGSLQGRGELDEPCAWIVVGREDGFIERDSVRSWVGYQRLHRGGVAIHRDGRVGDGDHRAAIEGNGGNGHGWRGITFRANLAAGDRQLIRSHRGDGNKEGRGRYGASYVQVSSLAAALRFERNSHFAGPVHSA